MGYRVKTENRWPDGKIYYSFDPNKCNEDQRDLIKDSMILWEGFVNGASPKPLIKFIEDANAKKRINIRFGAGNGASAGSVGIPGGVSNFEIGTEGLHAIPHELAHTIGVAHEHERIHPDKRDGDRQLPKLYLYYAGPVWDELPPNAKPNQKPLRNFRWEYYAGKSAAFVRVGDYDIKSITHYPSGRDLKWSDSAYDSSLDNKANNLRDGQEWNELNYPSTEQVESGRWEPSDGDVATIIELYTAKL